MTERPQAVGESAGESGIDRASDAVSRRRLVGATGTVVALALAGCAGEDGEESDPAEEPAEEEEPEGNGDVEDENVTDDEEQADEDEEADGDDEEE